MSPEEVYLILKEYALLRKKEGIQIKCRTFGIKRDVKTNRFTTTNNKCCCPIGARLIGEIVEDGGFYKVAAKLLGINWRDAMSIADGFDENNFDSQTPFFGVGQRLRELIDID